MAKKRKLRNQRVRQRSTAGHSRQWPLWGGVALVVAVVLGVIVTFQSGAGGSATDFALVAYQEQGILSSREANFAQFFSHGKPVVLNFWAGACPPCRAEMPGFQRVYDDLGDEFTMIGVDIGPFVGLGSHDDARRLLKEFNIRYPTAYAEDASPVRDYGVGSMPTTVFITPDGQIFDKRIGFLSEDRLRSKLQDLLAWSSSGSLVEDERGSGSGLPVTVTGLVARDGGHGRDGLRGGLAGN